MKRTRAATQKSGYRRRAKLMSTVVVVGSVAPVVGVDLGGENSVATILSAMDGSVVQETFSFTMDEEGYALFSRKVPRNDARIAFEATSAAYPFSRRLRALGYQDMTVAHATQLAWIVRSKKKNDRADSLKIARLHMAGLIPVSHLLEREEQVTRDLLIQRVQLGAEIGKMKTKIISYLKREDLCDSLPKTANKFSLERRRAIGSLPLDDDRTLILKTLMDRLGFLEAQCPPFEERIKRVAKENDDVKLLMSIRGVDFYLASLYSSYVGDAKRFPDDDHLNSFFGIIPVSKDSSGKKRRGKMSKEGPSIARWALGVMVDCVMKYNPEIRRYYNSVKERSNGGHAHIMTMKKLNRMLYHMLLTRERWKWEDEELTRRKLSKLESTEETHNEKTGGGDASA